MFHPSPLALPIREFVTAAADCPDRCLPAAPHWGARQAKSHPAGANAEITFKPSARCLRVRPPTCRLSVPGRRRLSNEPHGRRGARVEWPVLAQPDLPAIRSQWRELVACCPKRNAASWDFAVVPAAGAERQLPTEADICGLARAAALELNMSAVHVGMSGHRNPSSVHLHASGRNIVFLDRLFAGANRMKRTFGCQSGLALLHHPHPAP